MTLLVSILFIAITAALIIAITRGNLSAKIQKAAEFFDNHEYQQASEILKAILSKKKDYVPAVFLRARILKLQKQYLMAISELQGILSIPDFEKHANEAEVHQMLADLYKETQQWDKEINEYEKLIKLEPDNITANYRYGLALYKQKKYNIAKNNLMRAMELGYSDNDILFMIGICNYELSHFYEAEEFFLKAAEVPEYELDSAFYLGMIYKNRDDFEKAIEMFDKAKSGKKFYIQSLYQLGEIYYQRESFENAIKILEKGVDKLEDKKPESLDYRYLLSECYDRQNMITEAIDELKKIIKVNGDYKDAKIKLENYKTILENSNMKFIFDAPPEKLLPLIHEIITRMNYNVISKDIISNNELLFKAFNIKRINDPQMLVYFLRTTAVIEEDDIIDFYKKMSKENSNKGMFFTTSSFSGKAEIAAASRMIELFNGEYLDKTIDSIRIKNIK